MIEFAPIAETEVVSINPEASSLSVKLRSTAEPPVICPYCGSERVRNGTRKMIFHDVPHHGQPTEIEWRRQKFLCPRCSRSSHDAHPAFDVRHAVTKRFVDWVSAEGRKVTFSSLSKLSGVNEKVIRQIFAEVLRATEAQRATQDSNRTEMLAIELIEVAGSLHPALINIQNRKILDVFSSEETLWDFLAIDSGLGGDIVSATILVRDIDLPDELGDMFSPTADHLISRPSLHRSALVAMEAEIKPLLESRTAQKQSTGPDLALFRKRRAGLGLIARKRFSHWKDHQPQLYAMYDLKERLLNLWNFYTNPSDDDWTAWKRDAFCVGLRLTALIERIDSNRDAIDGYVRHHFLCHSYPEILAKVQQIHKAATHSFSASRAILLESQQ